MAQNADEWTFNVQSKTGLSRVNGMSKSTTLLELKTKIASLTNIAPESQKILSGFPPQPLSLTNNDATLCDIGLSPGCTLKVQEDSTEKRKQEQMLAENAAKELAVQCSMSDGGYLSRFTVPANNSCLFTSIDFVLHDGKLNLSSASIMRQIIASNVRSKPEIFTEAYLGKPNIEYCGWILHDGSWGGAIEIDILSDHFEVEIDVVDCQSGRIDRFGEDKHYLNRVLLIYDGVHYDPLVYQYANTARSPKTQFSTSDQRVLALARELGAEAKSSCLFTDVGSFKLQCLICNQRFTGDQEAQSHAREARHTNFREIKSNKI